jgi:hypothetical protein
MNIHMNEFHSSCESGVQDICILLICMASDPFDITTWHEFYFILFFNVCLFFYEVVINATKRLTPTFINI